MRRRALLVALALVAAACAGTSPEDTAFEVPPEVADSTAAADQAPSTSSPSTSTSSPQTSTTSTTAPPSTTTTLASEVSSGEPRHFSGHGDEIIRLDPPLPSGHQLDEISHDGSENPGCGASQGLSQEFLVETACPLIWR